MGNPAAYRLILVWADLTAQGDNQTETGLVRSVAVGGINRPCRPRQLFPDGCKEGIAFADTVCIQRQQHPVFDFVLFPEAVFQITADKAAGILRLPLFGFGHCLVLGRRLASDYRLLDSMAELLPGHFPIGPLLSIARRCGCYIEFEQ